MPVLLPAARAADIIRVSVNSLGNEANNRSWRPALSADGRFVAFRSAASNLVPGDTNGWEDVFVHDRETGITTRVSVDSMDNQANHSSFNPGISADGRFVAFESWASNLVPGDTNGKGDIFVHDRETGITTRVSVDSLGNQGNDGSHNPLTLSADGRFVAFESWASNLVPGDTNNRQDIFVHDRETGITTRVSVDNLGNEGNDSISGPALSADGRFVAFQSWASNLVPNDTNNNRDVFVHDRNTGITTRVSVDSLGNEVRRGGIRAALSADGRFVAFDSDADNLVSGDTNFAPDVFVHDRMTGLTSRISLDSFGNEATGDEYPESGIAKISAGGRFVVFYSAADNLVPNDTNSKMDIFVHDRNTGITTRVSVDSLGNEANGDSMVSALSANGRIVAFLSDADNLVPDDNNGVSDIFLVSLDDLCDYGCNTLVGLHHPVSGYFTLEHADGSHTAGTSFRYGPHNTDWQAIVGDWNGDGVDTVGLYNPSQGQFYLRNAHAGGAADIRFRYGPVNAGWIPVAGDWDNDGTDTVGLYDPSTGTFYLRNAHAGGVADVRFRYGPANAGWEPIAGDWDGNGVDTVGLYNPIQGKFYLRNAHAGGVADIVFRYGPANAGWEPLAGDWDGDDQDTVGLYRPQTGYFYLRNTHTSGVADVSFPFGATNGEWWPLAGKWH